LRGLVITSVSSESELAFIGDSIDCTVSTNIELNDVILRVELRVGNRNPYWFVGEWCDDTSLSEPKVMGFVNSPDNRVLSDGSLSDSTRYLYPVISGLLPNVMVMIDSDNLSVTSRNSNEIIS
jgi:hypothetical protein